MKLRPDSKSFAAAWVLVYAAESASMLQVLCTDAVAKTPDAACAIAAAKEAYSNT